MYGQKFSDSVQIYIFKEAGLYNHACKTNWLMHVEQLKEQSFYLHGVMVVSLLFFLPLKFISEPLTTIKIQILCTKVAEKSCSTYVSVTHMNSFWNSHVKFAQSWVYCELDKVILIRGIPFSEGFHRIEDNDQNGGV